METKAHLNEQTQYNLHELYGLFKQELVNLGFSGNIHLDLANRILNATDNSIYEILPQAVIEPKNAADIELLCLVANYNKFKTLTFTPRGGGTGTNGQSLTLGIVVDTSRYMHNILNFNPDDLTVTVEPGVILSEINAYLKPYGLFFAPMVSTANRATIGGMIATDAAGKGSLVYGKTNDHLLSLNCVLINGEKHEFRATSRTTSDELSNQIINLLDSETIQSEINKCFIPLKRPLSGYNIRQCVTTDTVDLTKLIAGSEGTLAFITAATLKLTKIPKYTALVVVHYNTFLEALADSDFLIEHQPLAIEAVDEKVQSCATTLPIWPHLAELMGLASTELMVSNFIEFTEDDESILNNKLAQLQSNLQIRKSRHAVIRVQADINQLWSIRSLAVGLVGKLPGKAKPIAFIEDAIVPPHNLYDFVADFKKILDGYKLNYAMYGHVDVGCVHVRPALDMQYEADREQIRSLSDEVMLLVERYQGLLWGEHGKGVRGEFVERVFGPVLYPVLQQIKTLFDPENRLNPGKLVTSYKKSSDVKVFRIDEIPMRGIHDAPILDSLQVKYSEALLCNGNAACFNREINNVMCPSYKATGDRIHSPKGRAVLLKEWLRSRSENKDKIRKIKTLELAEITFNAMQGCLGCKGCAGQCPTQVSIPDLRSKFLDEYHKLYRRRSLKEYMLAYLESLLSIAAVKPKIWNFLVKYKLIPTLGIQHIPKLSLNTSLRKELAKHNIKIYNEKQPQSLGIKSVVVIADVFTGFLDHEVLVSSCNTLKLLGYTPFVLYPKASGKSFIVAGLLNKFRQRAKKLQLRLHKIFIHGIPVVGIENSITLMYRDEYKKFGVALNGNVNTLAEFLVQHTDNFRSMFNDSRNSSNFDNINNELKCHSRHSSNNMEYNLLPHCTEQALCPDDAKNWQSIFAACGIKLSILNVGCCGMAGTYGHMLEHQETSRWLFDKHWHPKLESHNSSKTRYLATGYSCRSQAHILANAIIIHPVQFLNSFCGTSS